jgi:hypothetical protein
MNQSLEIPPPNQNIEESKVLDRNVPQLIRMTDSVIHPLGLSTTDAQVWFVYILLCQDHKIYVGKSKTHLQTVSQHRQFWTSKWVRKYPLVDVVAGFENCNSFDPDKFVLQAMAEYGIENVRGGSFDVLNLTEEQRHVLLRMIRSSLNKCFLCGMDGHYIADCLGMKEFRKTLQQKTPNPKMTWKDYLCCSPSNGTKGHDDDSDEEDKKIEVSLAFLTRERVTCNRCGRDGHWTAQCYAQKHKDGEDL